MQGPIGVAPNSGRHGLCTFGACVSSTKRLKVTYPTARLVEHQAADPGFQAKSGKKGAPQPHMTAADDIILHYPVSGMYLNCHSLGSLR